MSDHAAESALVCVVDDDRSLREALSSLLRSVGLAVETFDGAASFIERCAALSGRVACLVLDVRMPGLSGLELQRTLAERGCCVPIVFITAHGDIPMTVRAIKAGAVEFLPKPFSDQALLDAVNQALSRARTSLQRQVSGQAVRERYASLTPREREVLGWMVQGLRNKLTADRMGISEVTVKVHRHHVMEKMQAGSVPALLAMLEQADLPRGAH